jgi:phosphoenolpyruvate carboxykinase (ATP)
MLDPQTTWDDPDAYERQAKKLARMFVDNFERFAGSVPDDVVKAGPSVD